MISAIVLVKNEEKNIVDSLESVLFCNEIIIVDDDSTDRTVEIAERYKSDHDKIKIYKRKLNGDFSAQRRFAIDKAINDWIFFVDADERISKELAEEINEKITPSTRLGGYLIKRIDHMWGRDLLHGETGNIYLLRLFNKTKGDLKGKVHEVWQTKEEVGKLLNPMMHYPHPTISQFLREINFYSDLRARELYEKRVKSNFFTIILYTKGKFFKNYLLKRGFLDGTAGFVHAVLMAFHSFLVRGKLYLLWQKKDTS